MTRLVVEAAGAAYEEMSSLPVLDLPLAEVEICQEGGLLRVTRRVRWIDPLGGHEADRSGLMLPAIRAFMAPTRGADHGEGQDDADGG